MHKLNPNEGNFFSIPNDLPGNFELFQPVISDENVSIERIISTGQKTPDGQWLEQDKNEWVILLQGHAEILFEDGDKHIILPGHYFFIPGNTKHKITMTSSDPPCIWLAVHY
ncbi:MAG TPA: cupin domain-containing protein [Ignavibacteria bacterium]|nr:cupin domain-containing protein [Ignavibacteria bacterium]HMR39545.1 cupin domain-containing protein [Ignavibacteria bacterium]